MTSEKYVKAISKGDQVSMVIDGNDMLDGIAVENECSSPTIAEPYRRVVRVKWSDKSQSIENVKDLF